MQHILRLEREVASRKGAVRAVDTSPERFEIFLEALDTDRTALPGFPRAVPHALSSVRNIKRSLTSLDENPTHPPRGAPAGFLRELEAMALSLGVDSMGYAKLPRGLVFRDRAVMHDNAIVLVMEMDRAKIDQAPHADTAVMVHETYDRLGRAANGLAKHLRRQGYSAHAGHPLMGLVLYPPLAQRAGLGWRGLHGLLITPDYGPRVRLAAVFTSIETLPLSDDNPHGWIEVYCAQCQRCVEACPAGAIQPEPRVHASGLVTCVEGEACFPFFAEQHGCSICIRVCPFHRRAYETLKRRMGVD
jgi:NAD-dependent dihydropyrimidine dehydrogenase PreA subunit